MADLERLWRKTPLGPLGVKLSFAPGSPNRTRPWPLPIPARDRYPYPPVNRTSTHSCAMGTRPWRTYTCPCSTDTCPCSTDTRPWYFRNRPCATNTRTRPQHTFALLKQYFFLLLSLFPHSPVTLLCIRPSPYTLYSEPYILNPTPYTLKPYTIIPILYNE
jgi:hypothetical protein